MARTSARGDGERGIRTYELIESPHNPLVQQVRRLAKRREREARCLCVVEGPHLVLEAAAAGADLELLMVLAEGAPEPGGAGGGGGARSEAGVPPVGHLAGLPPARRTVAVSRRVLEAVAETEAPQGVLAVVRIPAPQHAADARLVLAADGLRDPGNLGTLLRAAVAFGASMVVLGRGCADPWGGKALRAAAGATFRLPPLAVTELAGWLRARAGNRWALVPRGGEPLPLADLGRAEPLTLVVGSEAAGVSPQVEAACRPLTIPMPGPAESLNVAVAAAVALYEAARRRVPGPEDGGPRNWRGTLKGATATDLEAEPRAEAEAELGQD